MRTTWAAARAWRLRRHFLGDERAPDVRAVIGRLTTIPAWSGYPELAVALRLARPRPDAVADALAEGELVRTYTFGGATHLMRPEDAGALLALRAAGRQWELPSWRTHYRLTPEDWPPLRARVREALAEGPRTRAELAALVTADPRFAHLSGAFTDPSHTFLKPFAWQGDLCLGAPRDGEVTLQSLSGHPGWTGIPDLDDAGRSAILAYLGAYGPAPVSRLLLWFGEGLSAGTKRIHRWVDDLGDRLDRVDVDGDVALLPAEQAGDLAAAEPENGILLLPGHDQWVRGPGTSDARIVPPALRPLATRGANLVLRGGVVQGTWRVGAKDLALAWSGDGDGPTRELHAAGERMVEALGRPGLDVTVS